MFHHHARVESFEKANKLVVEFFLLRNNLHQIGEDVKVLIELLEKVRELRKIVKHITEPPKMNKKVVFLLAKSG